jgi:hypothetical protein
MHWNRIFPFFLTLGGVVLLTGALRGPVWRTQRSGVPDLPAGLMTAPVDAKANALVDQALVRLAQPGFQWLRAGLWLRAQLPDLSFAGEGSYVRAPGQRFRVEMRTQLEGASNRTNGPLSTVLSVCDGRDLWTANGLAGQPWQNVKRLRLGEILDRPQGPASLPQVRSEFLTGPALRGIDVCLRSLQGHFDWVRREEHGGDNRLIGRWKAHVAQGIAPADKPWPEALPRYCVLTLRGDELWPARIEWWGPLAANGPDRLLVELEFRDPVINQPLADSEQNRLFAFHPGAAPVEDLTPRIHADLVNRAKQLTAAKP